MKKRGFVTIVCILILWIVLGMFVDNSIKLPNLFEVVTRMGELVMSPVFYISFGYTFIRSIVGLIVALVVGICLGMMSGLNQKFEEYFEPIYIILKSIPNVSYILIVLIWTNSAFVTALIGFMILFPMVYANVLHAMKAIDATYLDVMKIYPESTLNEVLHVYLPLISSSIFASLSNGMGLTFKVGIMAEILGSVSPGLGRQFQLCRINVDMVSLFAWTIWLILFLIVFEKLVLVFKKYFQ